jgi:hypothetical protein
MSSSGQKILIVNPDGSIKQLSTDANGNLNVNAVGVTLSTTGLALESGGNLAAIKVDVDKIPSKGTATMTSATPVTIATDDTLTAAMKTDLDNIKTDADKIPNKGTAVMAGSTPVTIATDDTILAAVKADVDKIPSKGTATMAGSTPVTIATDDTLMTAIKGAPGLLNSPAAYATTASYASAISGPLTITRPYKKITINVKENNTNSILYQIIGYTETSTWARPMTLATALPVAKNGADFQIVDMPLLAIDVQAVDAVGGTHGSVNVDVVLG